MIKILYSLSTLALCLAGRGCKNPKGSIGDTYSEGCYEFTCKPNGKWAKENICLDFKPLKSGLCLGCPLTEPICTGTCLLGRCFGGFCTRFPLGYPRNCAIKAADMSEGECKSSCSSIDSCETCLASKMPEQCRSLPSFSCIGCVGSITRAYLKCKTNPSILQCMKDHIEGSKCLKCICSLGCLLFGKDSTLCKACTATIDDNNAMLMNDVWMTQHPNGTTTKKCPPQWFTKDNENCFLAISVADDGHSWPYLNGPNGLGFCGTFLGTGESNIGLQMAVADSTEKQNAVTDAINANGLDNCWLAAKQNPVGPNPIEFYWQPYQAQTSIVSQQFWDFRCPDYTKRGSCIYTNSGGAWCNDNCQTKKTCMVCEVPATVRET